MEVRLGRNVFTLIKNIMIDYHTGSITLELRSNIVGPTTYQGRLDPAELDRVMESQDPEYADGLLRVFLDNCPEYIGPDGCTENDDRVPTYCTPGERVQLEFTSVEDLIKQNVFMQEINDSIRNGNYFYQLGDYKYPIAFKGKDLYVSYPGGRLDPERLITFINSFIPDPYHGKYYEMCFKPKNDTITEE